MFRCSALRHAPPFAELSTETEKGTERWPDRER